MQFQKWQNDLCSFPRQTFQFHRNPSLCPNQECWRSWNWTDVWRPTRPSRTNTPKRCSFPYTTTTTTKSLQSCLALCDCTDGSPLGSSIPGILQARTLEWVAISFSNAWKWKVKMKSLSRVRLLAAPWTAAYQAPLSMGFSRQEYWSGLPLPSPSFPYRGL